MALACRPPRLAAMPGQDKPPRLGLALAGGGPLGAIYEIGALCALDESLCGVNFARMDAYVGVSAGGFIAAALANGITPREICASFIENVGPALDIFEPSILIRPAWREIAKRLASLPGWLARAGANSLFGRRSWSSMLDHLGRALPAGVFSNDVIDEQLRRQFAAPGRTNDFRDLRTRLVLVATDLDSAESAPFGLPGWDHVPISKAVQASSALPGLFPPVEIDGRHFVDGALKKTMHASVLLAQGIDVLFCLNPLVPFHASAAPHGPALGRAHHAIPRMADGGLPVVLSQTFRTLIHSRLELGMKAYESSHPDTEILLFEPDQRDPQMFLANTFSYAQRRELAEHAYQHTRRTLRARRRSITTRLARHGISLAHEVLDDPRRTLLQPLPARESAARALQRLDGVLDELEHALQA